jgi:tRNA (guanine10-N2)-methyltransferase
MDAELALVTANLALAAPGKLFYDPFCGTGGFPLAAAHAGACAWGSDIDGRSIRGKDGRSVRGNFEQYGLLQGWMDGFVADLTNSPVRRRSWGVGGRWLDGIVCDPPYGVREGLKVLGCREEGRGREAVLVDGVPAHT